MSILHFGVHNNACTALLCETIQSDSPHFHKLSSFHVQVHRSSKTSVHHCLMYLLTLLMGLVALSYHASYTSLRFGTPLP